MRWDGLIASLHAARAWRRREPGDPDRDYPWWDDLATYRDLDLGTLALGLREGAKKNTDSDRGTWDDLTTAENNATLASAFLFADNRPGDNSDTTNRGIWRVCPGGYLTLQNVAYTTASGWAGSGTTVDPYRVELDGTNDRVFGVSTSGYYNYLRFRSLDLLVWVRTTAASATVYCEGHNSSQNAVDLCLIGGRPYGRWLRDGSLATTGDPGVSVNDGNWHLLGLHLDASQMYVSVDGVRKTNTAVAISAHATAPNTDIVGARYVAGAYSEHLAGAVSGWVVYGYYDSRRVTDQMLSDLYSAGPAMAADPPTAWRDTGLIYWASAASARRRSGWVAGEVPALVGGGHGNEVVTLPSACAPGLSDITAEAWVRYPYGASRPGLVLGNDPNANSSWSLALAADGAPYARVIDSGGTQRQASASRAYVSDGAWHHVVATYDRDGYARIYVDGVERGSADISAAASVSMTRTVQMVAFGSWCGGHEAAVARLYHRLLSASEVAAHYQQGIWGLGYSREGLVADYHAGRARRASGWLGDGSASSPYRLSLSGRSSATGAATTADWPLPVPDTSGAAGVTMELVLRPKNGDAAGWRTLASGATADASRQWWCEAQMVSGSALKVRWRLQDEAGVTYTVASSGGVLPIDGRFHHLALRARWDASVARARFEVAVDGAVVASYSPSATTWPDYARLSVPESGLWLDLAALRLWARALSDAELGELASDALALPPHTSHPLTGRLVLVAESGSSQRELEAGLVRSLRWSRTAPGGHGPAELTLATGTLTPSGPLSLPAGAHDLLYEDTYFLASGVQEAALLIGSGASNIVFRRCVFESLQWNAVSINDHEGDTSDIVFEDCVFRGGRMGFECTSRPSDTSSGGIYQRITLRRCVVEVCGSEGVSFDGPPYAANCLLEDVLVKGAGQRPDLFPWGQGLEINGPQAMTLRRVTVQRCRGDILNLGGKGTADCGWLFEDCTFSARASDPGLTQPTDSAARVVYASGMNGATFRRCVIDTGDVAYSAGYLDACTGNDFSTCSIRGQRSYFAEVNGSRLNVFPLNPGSATITASSDSSDIHSAATTWSATRAGTGTLSVSPYSNAWVGVLDGVAPNCRIAEYLMAFRIDEVPRSVTFTRVALFVSVAANYDCDTIEARVLPEHYAPLGTEDWVPADWMLDDLNLFATATPTGAGWLEFTPASQAQGILESAGTYLVLVLATQTMRTATSAPGADPCAEVHRPSVNPPRLELEWQ